MEVHHFRAAQAIAKGELAVIRMSRSVPSYR